ncbi:MAG: ferrous iron transport protein A [Chloroflexi bacterium]|nr:ferrous iron transport protein A [Chloroflexota bacterium]
MTHLTDLFHPAITPHPHSTTVPLSLAAANHKLRLVEIHAGHQLTHRLAELGITRGVELEVVQDAGGPLLISVRGSRIAMGRGMAHKLLVAPV